MLRAAAVHTLSSCGWSAVIYHLQAAVVITCRWAH